MDNLTILGVAAGVLTTVSFVPQVIRALKTRHTKDISFYMFFILVIGVSLWLLYGVLKKDLPIVAANAVTLVLASAILVLKIKHG